MHGLLCARGIPTCQRRVGESLRRSFPFQHSLRSVDVHNAVNPVPYRATFFGVKIHFDQNEKLAMYGVTHVLAVDGYSRKIVGFVTMPKKNPLTIYNTLFHPILQHYGLWDQVRMDHGTEFVLVTTVQQHLAPLRDRQHHHPALQTTSRQNHRAERLWVEVNRRLNYPMKAILVEMEGSEEIIMTNDITKFCVSWVTINVILCGVEKFISSWNAHRIPGSNGGIPNVLARIMDHTTRLPPGTIHTVENAVSLHTDGGGRLTPEGYFGVDPIQSFPQLQSLRERDFQHLYPSLEAVFENVVIDNGELFKQAIHSFITLTGQYATLV